MALRDSVEIDGVFTAPTGLNTEYDGLVDGNYIYYTSSTETDDGWNIVKPNDVDDVTIFGRWIRQPRTNQTLSHGKLDFQGTTKMFFTTGTTSGGDGEVTVNLTLEDTTNGTAIFTNIRYVSAVPVVNTSSPIEVPAYCIKEITNSNKQLTLKLADGRGLLALGNTMENTDNGVSVQIMIVGE